MREYLFIFPEIINVIRQLMVSPDANDRAIGLKFIAFYNNLYNHISNPRTQKSPCGYSGDESIKDCGYINIKGAKFIHKMNKTETIHAKYSLTRSNDGDYIRAIGYEIYYNGVTVP